MTSSSRALDLAAHPEVYTIGRISTEFFLRGFEVIGRAHDDVLGGMIIMTMLGDALDRCNWEGLWQPRLHGGKAGAQACALGGAMLPLHANFAPDHDVFLKAA